MKALIYWIALVAVLLITSCKVFRPNDLFRTDHAYPYSDFKPGETQYRIKPYDKLSVQVFTNDGFRLIETSGVQGTIQQIGIEYLVDKDSTVKLPTIGITNLVGLTIREAELFLENKYSQYYQKPFVKLNVNNRRVLVFKSGSTAANVVDITNENFTLIEALAVTGGIDDYSKAFRIKLIRGDLNKPQVYYYNIRNIKDMENANFFLQANDIIYVESRPRYASRFVMELTPYLSILSTVLLIITLAR